MIAFSYTLLTLSVAVRGQFIPNLPRTISSASSSSPSSSENPLNLESGSFWTAPGPTKPKLVISKTAVGDYDKIEDQFVKRQEHAGNHDFFDGRAYESIIPHSEIVNDGHSQDHLFDWTPVDIIEDSPYLYENAALPDQEDESLGRLGAEVIGDTRSARDLSRELLRFDVEGTIQSANTKVGNNAEGRDRSARTKSLLDFANIWQGQTGTDFVTEDEMMAVKEMIIEAHKSDEEPEVTDLETETQNPTPNEMPTETSDQDPSKASQDDETAEGPQPSVFQGPRYLSTATVKSGKNESSSTELSSNLEGSDPSLSPVTPTLREDAHISTSSSSSNVYPGEVSSNTNFSDNISSSDSILELPSLYRTPETTSAEPTSDPQNSYQISRTSELATSTLNQNDATNIMGETREQSVASAVQRAGDNGDDDAKSGNTNTQSKTVAAATTETGKVQNSSSSYTPTEINISAHDRLYQIATNSMKADATIEESIMTRSFKYMYERKYKTLPGDDAKPGEVLLMFIQGRTAASDTEVKRFEELFDSVFQFKTSGATPFGTDGFSKFLQPPF